MTTRRALILGSLVLMPLAAMAHLPPGARGPHGGQVQSIGGDHGELVMRDGELTLFLFDHHDRPLDASQASGQATIQIGDAMRTFPFTPLADGSALVARGDFLAASAPRVVVLVSPRGGAARMQARFTPPGPRP